jgi:hypothetical protein
VAGPNGSFVPTAAGGDLVGSYPGPALGLNAVDSSAIRDGAILFADLSPTTSNGSPLAPMLRSLGTGATRAAAGNDSRLTDARPPTGTAGGGLTGSYPSPSIAAGAVTAAALGGNALLWARVSAAGTLQAGRGVVRAGFPSRGSGYLVEFDRDVSGCGVIATINEQSPTHIILGLGLGLDPEFVFIGAIANGTDFQLVDAGFTVRVVC